MKLNEAGLRNRAEWENKGYQLPKFNRDEMIRNTKENPFWIHFGAGNIFRAFQANVVQNLLNTGDLDRGITVVEGFDYEIIEKKYRPNDNYSILVTLKSDGKIEKTVVGSIGESCILDSNSDQEFGRLKEIFAKDSLQFATFSITEKGYLLVNAQGETLPAVKDDFAAGPKKPQSYIGKVAALLYHRYLSGKKPIAMVSTDNCSHNGDKLFAAVKGFAQAWADNGLVEEGFLDYIMDKSKVSFPWSMIDKITPRPDASVEEILKKDGLEELEPVVTSKNTYVAPFVNAEETEYLVIEDAFPNGRPALEKGGIIFTDKETVDKVERMKVCTCLNPLHTALAVYGCVLGYEKISDEMKDAELVKLVETIGYKEGLPVVINPGVLDPKEFIDTVLKVRIPNPFMPDTPQRIATDTSQKLAIRFGETIKNYQKAGKSLDELKMIPLVFAGWLRYLMAVNDNGESYELSPDPMLESACSYVCDIQIGDVVPDEKLHGILEDARIFGVDLYEVGMAQKVLQYFNELIAGKGAVRATLQKYLKKKESKLKFLDENFMLETETAQHLYHDYAKKLPIIDYHCHLSPKEIYEDISYDNITQVWLGADHYKWRQMRSNGVEERFITGDASDREKFQKWAETLDMAIGNPLYHWSHLELKNYFGYEGYLSGETAEEVWNLCNEKLRSGDMTARKLIEKSNVRVICTTDDPIDSLEWHQKLREDGFSVRVLPSWRPDKALHIENDDFASYIQILSEVSGIVIDSLDALMDALRIRMDHFAKSGCCVSDHGLEYIMYEEWTEEEVQVILKKRLEGLILSAVEIRKYQTALMVMLGKEYAKRNWVMQLHYGVQRDLNKKIFHAIGADAGIDAINTYSSSIEMGQYLNALAEDDLLPKTIIYSLNPADDAAIGTVIGCFQDSGCRGKIQHGSAWWFNDSKTGMVNQMTSLANLGLLGNFIGMLTDSRSFLSYTRHEYFRRIMCNLIGGWVENGEYPAAEKSLKKIVEGISYYNAKEYFQW